MPKSCEICDYLPHEDHVVLTTNYWTVSVSADQSNLGRCFVTLKEHKSDLKELADEEWQEYIEIVNRLEKAVEESLGAEVFNWSCLMNNAFQAESANPHVHWHLRPRHRNKSTIGGVEFEDKMFGYHYDRDIKFKPPEAVLTEITNMIKENL